MRVFSNWSEAHREAMDLGNACKRDVGIAAGREYGKQVYTVFLLPEAGKRYGCEATCEVVAYNEGGNAGKGEPARDS